LKKPSKLSKRPTAISGLKFVPYKDRKSVCVDLKKIYGAVNLEDAEYAKEEFREIWNQKYPAILRSWDDIWADLITKV
jgi:putative transposase